MVWCPAHFLSFLSFTDYPPSWPPLRPFSPFSLYLPAFLPLLLGTLVMTFISHVMLVFVMTNPSDFLSVHLSVTRWY